MEINEELAKGKTNVSGAKELSFSERPVTFSFSVSYDEETEDFVTTAKKKKPAWKKKNFSAKVSYGGIGGFGGFWHKLYGDFKYRQGKVGNYYYNDDYGGPLYAKSSKKSSKRTDPSVVRVSTKGSFRALKYSPVEYTTNIEIGLYGSGTYQIHRAKIN
ncbi:hypothetical protein [Numidum massiliense]|uniref:hypothetical protein n=1 Tax=Numidum massiliense TaxID=1522315 RepID=UPI0006D55006|nr:hypothetical protein [Numidum massiliense]